MQPHRHVLAGRDVAEHESQLLHLVEGRHIGIAPGLADGGVDVELRRLLDEALAALAIGDEVRHRNDLEAVLAREGQNLGAAFHRSVVIDEFANHAGRVKPCELHEIDGRFRMARAHQHAARLGDEREDMARAHEIIGHHIAVGQRMAGRGAFLGRNAGGEAFLVIDGDGEGGAHRRIVQGHHGIELQALGVIRRDGGADDAGGVAHHEGHLFRRDLGGGGDQIALVLAVVVIDHHHHFARGNGLHGLLDGIELVFVRHVLISKILRAHLVARHSGNLVRQLERGLRPRHELRDAALGDAQLPRQRGLRCAAINEPFGKLHVELLAMLIMTCNHHGWRCPQHTVTPAQAGVQLWVLIN